MTMLASFKRKAAYMNMMLIKDDTCVVFVVDKITDDDERVISYL